MCVFEISDQLKWGSVVRVCDDSLQWYEPTTSPVGSALRRPRPPGITFAHTDRASWHLSPVANLATLVSPEWWRVLAGLCVSDAGTGRPVAR